MKRGAFIEAGSESETTHGTRQRSPWSLSHGVVMNALLVQPALIQPALMHPALFQIHRIESGTINSRMKVNPSEAKGFENHSLP